MIVKLNDVLESNYHLIELPLKPNYFHYADCIISKMNKPTKAEIFENRVAMSAYYFLIKEHTFYKEKAWCSHTHEELRVHHCLYNDIKYEIAVMRGAFNRKHKNFKRVDKVCICAVENCYVN